MSIGANSVVPSHPLPLTIDTCVVPLSKYTGTPGVRPVFGIAPTANVLAIALYWTPTFVPVRAGLSVASLWTKLL
jgi:hypothetical protein